MPLYRYKGISSEGKKVGGTMDAPSLKEAKSKLRGQGLMITSLEEGGVIGSKQRLVGDTLANFTMQLSQLVGAGVPLLESLVALEEQYRGETAHGVVLSLSERVRAGASLSEAMADYPDSFDGMYRAMVQAGEAAGALDLVLERLCQFLRKQLTLKRQLMTALIYPVVLAAFSGLLILLLLTFVVPSLEGMFEGREVNALTSLVFGTSRFLREGWVYYVPLIVLLGFLTWYQVRRPAFHYWWQSTKLRLPLIRNITLQASLSRFTRTMATLIDGGLTLVDGLKIARGVLHNIPLEEVVQRAHEKILEGSSLSQELKKESVIPSMVWRMVAIGEDTGNSAMMFGRIADIYESDLERSLTRITALAQPVVLLIMGGIVGVILLAVLLPLLDVTAFID